MDRSRFFLRVFFSLQLAGLLLADQFLLADELDRFNRVVRPILAKHCFACHGRDEEARQADLRLDLRDSAVEGGAIKPGFPDQSEMVIRIDSKDANVVMPPPDSGGKLTAAESLALKQWIAEGAKYASHWSFTPPTRPDVPGDNSWSSHPIDRFIHAKILTHNLSPNAVAEPFELLRRVALDLTGLPPTQVQANAFLSNPSDEAYEALVDDLLGSDAYGEHWARMWLDLARYADTKGYEKDRERTIWRYRDWVIQAFNSDQPFDQFTFDQLAGDLIANANAEQVLATAFHRNTMENDEGGTDDEEFRVAAVKDRVDTTMQVWMGLTAGCAKCHSHKYDPISQVDYYQLFAFFNQTEDSDRSPPTVASPTVAQRTALDQLDGELMQLQSRFQNPRNGFDEAIAVWMKSFETTPLWVPLVKSDFHSEHDLQLNQDEAGEFSVEAELPEKDTWILTLDLPVGTQPLTSLRIDTRPKKSDGKWPDKNVALRELTVEIIDSDLEPSLIKLKNPRADFSQKGWEVTRAIDGNFDAGWAFSPKASDAHCAIFDFAEPIERKEGRRIRLTLEQEYGQGLLLDEFLVSTSVHPINWLRPDLDAATGLSDVFRREVFPATMQLAEKISTNRDAIKRLRSQVPNIPIMRELAAGKRRETRVHIRGNFLDQSDLVSPAVPSAFGALPEGSLQDRLGVARWLMHESNPLTARVAVNRLWSKIFGKGLVETEEDFGTQGSYPTHPDLLDWLAVEFRENGWSRKQLLKKIVLSKTYQQSAAFTDHKLAIDPRNDWLSRGPRFRLSAEMVRDQALAVSGLLTTKLGGPSVMPPQPDGIWKTTYSGEKWKNATGPDRYRRAIYTYKKRTSPYPAMTTFDSGSGEVCQIRRIRTNTPLQALVTLNDVAFLEAAGALSVRMTSSSNRLTQQIAEGIRMTLYRDATSGEVDRLEVLYQSLDFDSTQKERMLAAAGLDSGDPRMIALANVLLNLDEFLTKP